MKYRNIYIEKQYLNSVTLPLAVMFVFFIISPCFLISSSENIPPNNGVFLMNEINLLHLFFLIKSLRYLSDQKALHWSLQIRSSLSLSSNNSLWIKSSCFNSNSRFSFRNINASLTMRSDLSSESRNLKHYKNFL